MSEETGETGAPAPVPVPVPRRRGHHRRVVRPGTELFEEDGSDLGLGARQPDAADPDGARDDDDDDRILSELPPHWGVYAEREQSGA